MRTEHYAYDQEEKRTNQDRQYTSQKQKKSKIISSLFLNKATASNHKATETCSISILPHGIVHRRTMHSQTSIAGTSLGPWKCVRDIGSSSHWELIMASGQESNCDNLGKSFDLLHNNGMLSVLIRIRIASEAILMSTQNIYFMTK